MSRPKFLTSANIHNPPVDPSTRGGGGRGNPPNAPSNLTVGSPTQTTLQVSWTDNSTDEASFSLERATGANPFAVIQSLGANVTSFLDSALAASTTYIYRIRSVNAFGNSAYSSTASGTTSGVVITTPGEFYLSTVGTQDITLTGLSPSTLYHLTYGLNIASITNLTTGIANTLQTSTASGTLNLRFVVTAVGPSMRNRVTYAIPNHVYYMSLTGSDSNNGTTTSTPWRNWTKALPQLVAGDVLIVSGGFYLYFQTDQISLASGTSWNNPITISAAYGEDVSMYWQTYYSNVSYIISDRIKIDCHNFVSSNCLVIDNGAHHIRYQHGEMQNPAGLTGGQGVLGNSIGSEVLGSLVHDIGLDGAVVQAGAGGESGFYVKGDGWIIDGNEVYHCGTIGIGLYSATATRCNNCIIRNNIVHHNSWYDPGHEGILLGTGDNNQAYNNIIYSDTGYAILIANNNPTNTKVYNNTCFSTAGILINTGSTGASVKNNILHQSGSSITDFGVSSDISTNFFGNPLFVDEAGLDFRLQLGSPARNVGLTLPSVPVDILGVSRPQSGIYDLGAYES